jgi:carbamoyl-phosphate synthase large subunit
MTGPILLTGAGGDIGIAVARCLRDAFPAAVLVGADSRSDTAAPAVFDEVLQLPRADRPEYPTVLREAARSTGAALLLPLAEAELAVLLDAGALGRSIGPAKVVSASSEAVRTGLDKLQTFRVLRAAGLAVPDSGIVGVDEPGDYPLVVKPRSGQGSKGLLIVERAAFNSHAAARSGDLWQRLLADADEEYTCGVARFPGSGTRVMTFRRKLAGGFTGSGVLVDDPVIAELCHAIADRLDLRGAINVQLRKENGVPRVFEINPRFSSTVRFRHLLGFRDVVWSVNDALGEPVEPYIPPHAGQRIYRISEEIILPPA